MKFKKEKDTGYYFYSNPKGTFFTIRKKCERKSWTIEIENLFWEICITEVHPTKKNCIAAIDRLIQALPEEIR